jgi:hypothetical protein
LFLITFPDPVRVIHSWQPNEKNLTCLMEH